jgi:hypothetical protein
MFSTLLTVLGIAVLAGAVVYLFVIEPRSAIHDL